MDLKPCPFCGAEQRHEKSEDYVGGPELYTVCHEDLTIECGIDCLGCGVSVNMGIYGTGVGKEAREEMTVEMWNNRKE